MGFFPLSDRSAQELPEGAYDLRGWLVRTLVDRRAVGDVRDVLLDADGKPRYLQLALEDGERHILVPIGQARADRRRRLVWLPGLHAEQLAGIPDYPHTADAVTRPYEGELIASYRRALAGEESTPRTVYAGTVYGPSELEEELVAGEPARLAPLGSLERYRVVEGEPDPRGWEVLSGDGVTVGRVAEMLVDTRAAKVRHLVCAVDEAGLGLDPQDRHVLVPIGFARLDETRSLVIVDILTSAAVAGMPVYTGAAVGREIEQELLERLEASTGDRFYFHPRFDYRACFGPTADS